MPSRVAVTPSDGWLSQFGDWLVDQGLA